MKKTLLKEITLVLVFISLLLIIGLTVLVHYHPVLRFEVNFSRELQSEGGSPFEKSVLLHTLSFISFLGQTTVGAWIVFSFALFFLVFKYYREAIFSLLASLAPVINSGIKLIINRPRPTENLISVLDHELSPSYPSGHVVFFTVFFGYLITAMFFAKRIPKIIRAIIGLISFCLIILVSVSRIYLGAHWLTDVIAGYLLGVFLLTVLLYFYLRDYFVKK